jgi:hypothetical protein
MKASIRRIDGSDQTRTVYAYNKRRDGWLPQFQLTPKVTIGQSPPIQFNLFEKRCAGLTGEWTMENEANLSF